jgi:hypothetical protein
VLGLLFFVPCARRGAGKRERVRSGSFATVRHAGIIVDKLARQRTKLEGKRNARVSITLITPAGSRQNKPVLSTLRQGECF